MPKSQTKADGHECPQGESRNKRCKRGPTPGRTARAIPLRQQTGDGEHDRRRRRPYNGPGEDIEWEVNAEVEAGEDDEQSGRHENGGDRRVEDREGNGPRGGRGGVARGEGARGGRLDQGGYLRVPEKGSRAIEEILRAFSHRPRGGDSGPGDQEPRRLEAGEQERSGSQKTPEGAGRPRDGERAHHRR